MNARPKRESRAEKQARTRAELLATAARVFARRGYKGASVEEIAEEAGYSHGAVYSNFDGKADLFLAVFEDYMAERARELAATQVDVAEDAPLEVRARALADQWMERFARDRESFVLHMEFIAHAGRDPELAGRFGSRSASLREAVSRYIAEYQQESAVELAMPADDLALVLRALGIGLAVEALVSPDEVRQDLYGDFVELLVTSLRSGQSPPSSSAELVAELHRRQGEMYAGGPVAPVVELLAADIIWHVPGENAISGDHRGVEQVLGYFDRRRRLANATMRMHPGAVISEGAAVAQFVEGSAVLNGEPVSWQTVGIYRVDVEHRQIREVWLVPLDAALFDRIWAAS